MGDHEILYGNWGQILVNSRSGFLQVAEVIARTHHERWEGNDYLEGLAGKAIPLLGRIVAVTDVYDILTNQRVYKDAVLVRKKRYSTR